MKNTKKTEYKIDLNDYAIIDNSNVCGIFPIINKNDSENITEINHKMGYFKEYTIKEIKFSYDLERIEINGSAYSNSYFKQIKEIAKVWFSKEPKILMRYDKEEEKWLIGEPIMFIFQNKMCFILAPRVEEVEE